MKLSLEIELDWIDEESNLDETVKQNIIDAIVSKIQKKVETDVAKKANELIDQTIVAKINQLTESLFNDFMNKEVSITDSYGSTVKVFDNVTAVIKERFDNFMVQRVDEKGNTTDSNYGSKYPRLQFIIDKQLKAFAETFTKDAVKKVSDEIKVHVQTGLTTKLGAELMKVLKVNEMLSLPNGK